MASKKKMNGCRTIQCVKNAAKGIGCSLEEFFVRATEAENAARSSKRGRILVLDLEEEMKGFRDFEIHGVATARHYKIPAHVIRFAEKVTENRKRFFRRNRPCKSTRPSISASGH